MCSNGLFWIINIVLKQFTLIKEMNCAGHRLKHQTLNKWLDNHLIGHSPGLAQINDVTAIYNKNKTSISLVDSNTSIVQLKHLSSRATFKYFFCNWGVYSRTFWKHLGHNYRDLNFKVYSEIFYTFKEPIYVTQTFFTFKLFLI